MELKNGKKYLINHSRKGTFAMRVDSQTGTWINGVVIGGTTDAMNIDNKNFLGDPITIRASFIISAIEQP